MCEHLMIMKRTIESFHNRVFWDMEGLTRRLREKLFDDLIPDAERFGITSREVTELAEHADGKTFLARFRGLALERGITIIGS
jgi:hypothetical protein